MRPRRLIETKSIHYRDYESIIYRARSHTFVPSVHPAGGGIGGLLIASVYDNITPDFATEHYRTYNADGTIASIAPNPHPFRVNDNRHTITFSRVGDLLTFTMAAGNFGTGSETISAIDPSGALTNVGMVRLYVNDPGYGALFDSVVLTGVIPEPASLALLGLGSLALLRRRA